MLRYENPEIEVLRFMTEDILMTSPIDQPGGFEGPDPNPGDGDPGDVTDPGGPGGLDGTQNWFK